MSSITFDLARLERLSARRGPTYLADCRACGTVTPDGLALTFDTDSACWRALQAAKAPKPGLRGLGDVVARVTSAVGIQPCGKCKERQAALNKLVPFRKDGRVTP